MYVCVYFFVCMQGHYSKMVGCAATVMMFVGSRIISSLGWKAGAMMTPAMMGLLVSFLQIFFYHHANTYTQQGSYLPTYIHTHIHMHACIHTYSNRTSTLTALQSLKYTYIHKYIRTYIHISILYNLTLLSIVGLPVLQRSDLRRFGLPEGSSNGSVCGLSAERLIEGHQICHFRSYKGDDIHTSGKNISQPYIHIQFKVCIHYA
jgi:hypothetical protein